MLIGQAAKFSSYLMELEKTYEATVQFGIQTDTLDPHGKVIADGPIPQQEAVTSALTRFTGTIAQVPPAYSAVHINGERSYKRVLQGETPELKPRPVTIHAISMNAFNPVLGTAVLSVRCSKGTYIRSLARDIAHACGTCGHLVQLCRTQAGPFSLDAAVRPQDWDPDKHLRDCRSFISDVPGIKKIYVHTEAEECLRNGKPLQKEWFLKTEDEYGKKAVFTKNGELLGLINCTADAWTYLFGVSK